MAYWIYFTLFLFIQLQAKVRGDCEIPWNVTIQNSLIITWSGEDRETDVLIQVTPDATSTNKECKSQHLTVPFSTKEVRIDPLCSNTTHIIKASLACGDKITQTKEFELLSDDVLAPSNFSFVAINNISITLEWDAPEFSEKPIIAYQVRRSKTDAFEAADIYHTSTTEYTFAGLVPYTIYYFEVRASTETTVGPWSETLSQKTKVGVPFAPVGVSEEYVTNSSIAVKWKEPQPFCGPIILYAIQYSKKSDPTSFNDTIVESTNYTIENLLPYTEYSIQVRAKTEAGFGPWSAALIVLTDVGIPSVPTDLVATNTTARSILLFWNAPDPANGPSLEYLMSWGVRGSSISQVLVLGTEFLADTLVPHTEYSFQVAAKTSAGLGPKSKRLYVWTKIDVPSEPLNLTAVEVKNTSITIEWESPQYHNGPILAYIVQYSEFSNETTNDTNASIIKETKENITTLESLKPNTLYVFRVCAKTDAGTGPYSDYLEILTDVGVPGPPKEIYSEVNVTSIILTWQQPDHVPGTLLDYLLSWGVQGTPESTVIIKNEFLHYDAVGLRPYTAYSFRLAARTEAGAGPAVSILTRTEITTPSIPRELRAFYRTDTSIFLKWLAPEHPNGPLVSYTVKWYDASNSPDTVGLQETNSTSFSIMNLEPSTNYSVQIVAKTSAGEGPWSNIVIASTTEKRSPNNHTLILAIVLGTVIPLLFILIITGIIFARRKGACKLRKEPPKQSQERQVPSISSPTIQLESIQRNPRNLTIHNFEESMKAMTRYGTQSFMQEFEDLKKDSPIHHSEAAKREDNLTKNRWIKILPFDYSRVKIQTDGQGRQSNFINASYIPGDSYLLEYIATQGPLPNTVNDFWTLVWQQSVPVIVMLTQCVERAVKNCEKYWPNTGETKLYGDVQVNTKSENILTSHVQRVFVMKHQNQQRHVIHMHFTSWPVSGCPRSPEEFLHFVRLVRMQITDKRPGPILVHCSAGVGRTGTFIAVDRILQHVQQKEDVDIYGTVLEMRRYRPHMVHTADQYIFIYSCINQFILDKKEAQEDFYETIN